MSSALARYRTNAVTTGGPNEILLALFDGAVRYCQRAKEAIIAKDIAAKREAVDRVIAIVREFAATLDHDKAPELCAELTRLYDYLVRRMLEASAKLDPEPVEEVRRHLAGLRDAFADAVAKGP